MSKKGSRIDNLKSQNKLICNQEFLLNSMLSIMQGIDINEIIDSINRLDDYTKVASYIKLSETTSKLNHSYVQLQLLQKELSSDELTGDIVVSIIDNEVVNLDSVDTPKTRKKSPKKLEASKDDSNTTSNDSNTITIPPLTNVDNYVDNLLISSENDTSEVEEVKYEEIQEQSKILSFNNLSSQTFPKFGRTSNRY